MSQEGAAVDAESQDVAPLVLKVMEVGELV